MADDPAPRARCGEAFWRTHHESWKRNDLNRREHREAQGIPLKAFSNWRAKFKAEPQPVPRKLLYRRGGVSHTPSHRLSHTLSHVTYPSSESPVHVVPPVRAGHRRRFCEADRRHVLAEAPSPASTYPRSRGTLYERSHVPLNKWLLATQLLSASKKGMSTHQLHRMLGVTYKTAWFVAHRIREGMRDMDTSPVGGQNKVVEADETYVGGKAKNRAYKTPPKKEAVFALVERDGKVRS